MRPHAAFIWMSLCGALTSILKIWAVWERGSRHWDTTQQSVTNAQRRAIIDPTQCVGGLLPVTFSAVGGILKLQGGKENPHQVCLSEQWQLTTELRLQVQGTLERVVAWWSLSHPHILFLLPETLPRFMSFMLTHSNSLLLFTNVLK